MKKILTVLAITAAAMSAPAIAQAQTQEVGVGAGVGGGAALVHGRYGYNFNDNFRLEAEAATGTALFLDIDYYVSGYAVGRMPFGDNNSAVFARVGVGYMAASFDDDCALFCGEDSSAGFAQAGVGVEYFFTQSWGLRADATVLLPFETVEDADGDSLGAMGSASLVYRF